MLADKYAGESVLITFDPHPRKVLYPEAAGKNLKLINSQAEKLELLRNAGLDNIIIIEFTRDFSKITSEQFVSDYLCGILKAKVVVVGFNHHFGFQKEGDYKLLWSMREKYNFEAEEIPEQEVQHETVSSTKIRQAISEGYIQRANAYLDHYYIIIGKPKYYDYQNSVYPINMFKIQLTEECKLLPPPGIYAVMAESGPVKGRCMAVITGNTETGSEVLINLIEKDYLLHDLESTLYFHKKIHGSIDLNDQKTAGYRLRAARAEISELIY
jgi:riboflavin kinase/FMN adenylyltransferase